MGTLSKKILLIKEGSMSKKIFLFILVLCLGLFSLNYAQVQTKFKDVPPTHWAAEAVKYLTDIGIMVGIRPDTFGGDMYVTRYQVAVLLYKLIQQFKLAELVIPAKDIAELKTLVKELSEELTLLGGRVDDLMATLDELSGRVADIESVLGEKASLEEVEALIEEKIAEIEIPDISELEGRVSDLEGLVGDLDSRLSDVEVALTEKASLEEVEALVGEVSGRVDELEGRVGDLESQVADLATQIAEIEKIEVTEEQIRAVIEVKLEETIERITREVMEELISRVTDLEGLVVDLDSRLVEVEVALTEKASLEEVEALVGEGLAGVTERLDGVEAVVSDLDMRVGDLEVGISDILAVTDDLSSNLISLSERVDALEGLSETVDNLAGFVEDIEGRVSDIEVLLVDRPTMDEVIALLEEKLAEIEIPDVEELKLLIEEHTDAIDALRSDVDAILVEEIPTMKDDIASLQDQVAELSDRVSLLEAGVRPEVVEVPVEVEELSKRLETLEVVIDDVYSLLDDLALGLTDLSEKVSTIEEAVSGVQGRVAGLEKSIGKFTISGSISATVRKEFGVAKNITVDDSTKLNLTFTPVDGVKISTSISLKGITSSISTSLNKLSVSVSEAVFGMKNLALIYDHTASGNFGMDVYGLVGSKTAKLVISSDLPFQGVKSSIGVNGSYDGTGEDLVAVKVYGSMSNINYNIFGSIGRSATNVAYGTLVGVDLDTVVGEGIKLFGEAVYDGTFDVLGGVSLSDVGIKGLSSTLKATYKDNKLTLYGSASYPVSPQAKVTGEVTVSDVTTTPAVTVKGTVEGAVVPFAYKTWLQADLKTNVYSGYAELSYAVDPYSLKIVADIPDLTELTNLNKTKLTIEGSYKFTPNLKLSALATTHYENSTAAGKVWADLTLAPNVNVNLTVLKKALGTLTTDPIKDLSVSLTTSVGF